jgi:hypothetical protein
VRQADTYGLAGCRPGRSLGLPCSEPPGELLITAHSWQAVRSGQRLRALIGWGRPAGGGSVLSACLPRGAEDEVKLAELQGQR